MKFLKCFMIAILILVLGYQNDAVSQEIKRPRKKQKKVIGLIPSLKSGHIRYIDAHMHLKAAKTGNKDKIDSATLNMLETMDKLGIQKCLLMPPPYTSDMPKTFDYRVLARISKMHPKRLGFIGGGGSLNIMIHQSVIDKQVSSELRKRLSPRHTRLLKRELPAMESLPGHTSRSGRGTHSSMSRQTTLYSWR